jgi:hypothetical protein
MQLPQTLTPAQAKVYEVIQRNRMAWTALGVVLGLFTIGFFSFLYALFFVPSQAIGKSALAGLDALLGWSLRAIISNLFPSHQAKS